MNPLARTPKRLGILDRVLESWGMTAPSAPTATALGDLHASYLTFVPFENATKLVKAARAMSPQAAIRGPVEFWEDHLRWGSGGTCFASTYAYQFLLRFLGYNSQLLFCRLPSSGPQAHAALLVEAEGAPWLVDVGYALPAPLAIPSRGTAKMRTALYDMELRRGARGEFLLFTEDDRGQRFRYQVQLRGTPETEYLAAWQHTFRLEAPYMRRLALGRFRGATRYLYKESGMVYAISRQGEMTVPLDGDPTVALARFFALPEPLMDAAVRAQERLGQLRSPLSR
jgi:arylamine N-acetyltransferase